MSRAQQYISSLLERIPIAGLPAGEQQTTFDRIRDKLGNSPDVTEELRKLYKVNNFSDFALSLIWIAEKIENDPSRLDPTNDEEALVFSMYQRAFGAAMSNAPEVASAEPAPTVDFPPAEAEVAPANPFESFPAETPPESTSEPAASAETFSPFDALNSLASTEQTFPSNLVASQQGPAAPPESPAEPPVFVPESTPMAADVTAGTPEAQHAVLFERFVEALQNASDDRTALFDQLLQLCNSVASGDGVQEYKEYSQLLSGLLKSLSDNQMLDDIRAMNMLSASLEPFSQWAKSDPAGREGGLQQGIEAVRGFKSLFE